MDWVVESVIRLRRPALTHFWHCSFSPTFLKTHTIYKIIDSADRVLVGLGTTQALPKEVVCMFAAKATVS